MYQRIVVPLDGSQIAESILPMVEQLGAGLNASVQLLSVIEEDVMAAMGYPLKGLYDDQVRVTATGVATDYLKKVTARLKLPAGRVQSIVKVAHVVNFILEETERQPNSLLVMSTHSSSSFQRFALGSVADKLLHATKSPLFLYRPQKGATPDVKLQTVIVALDGSELAEKALAHVTELTKALSLKVVLVRVTVTASEPYGVDSFYAVPQQVIQILEKETQDYLTGKVADLKSKGMKDVSSQVLFGSPASQIIELAKKTPHSFVAISTHGRSGFSRWILGSVMDRIVREVGMPVLVIR